MRKWGGSTLIESLKVVNWKGFASSAEWKFNDGIQLVYGQNASGKSSILEAIKFAFFGIDESLDDIPNNNVNEDSIVQLDFIGKDDSVYRIVRSYKKIKKKQESFNLYKIENGNETYISDDPELAMELFGTPPDILSHIVFLNEGEIYKALTRPKNNLSSELAEILNLSRYDELQYKLRTTRLNYVKRLKGFVKETSLILTSKEEKELNKQIAELTDKIKLELERKEEIENHKDIAEKKEKLSLKIAELEREKEEYGKTIKEIRSRYSNPHNISKLLEEEIIDHNKSQEDLQAKQDEINKIKYSAEAEKGNYKKLIKEIEEFESTKQTTCPTCYQKVDSKVLQSVKNTFTKEFNEKQETYQTAVKQLDEIKKDIKENKIKLRSLEKDTYTLEQAQKYIDIKQQKINEISEEIRELPKTEGVDVYKSKIDKIDQEINNLKVEKQKRVEIIRESKEEGLNFDELEFQEQFIHLIEKKVNEHKEETLERRLNEVKDVIKEKWSIVMDKEIWSIEFDKNFIPHIKYKDKTLSLRSLSGSEKIMLSVIMRAALMDKVMSRKTLILDDPAIFLDSENIVKAAEFYRELINTNQLSQIILTTFDERFKNEINAKNVIKLD